MSDLTITLAVLLAGFAVFYTTRVLLFSEKSSHFGPFPSRTKRVLWARQVERVDEKTGITVQMYSEYVQPVTWFDWFRRLFGVYAVSDIGDAPIEETWYVKNSRIEVWTCTTCLSFWVAAPYSILLLFVGMPVVLLPLTIPALAAMSLVIEAFIERDYTTTAEVTYALSSEEDDEV